MLAGPGIISWLKALVRRLAYDFIA